MVIKDAINIADCLCPNHYSLEEKVRWCDEVSSAIRGCIRREYAEIEQSVSNQSGLILPDGLSFDMVDSIFLGGKRLNKTDFRSYEHLSGSVLESRGINFSRPLTLRIVYLTAPEPIRLLDIRGSFKTDADKIYIEDTPFKEGDCIKICTLDSLEAESNYDGAETAYVMQTDLDGILLDHACLEPSTEAVLGIWRELDDELECPLEFENMYPEYLLAKIALYSRDYEAYSAHTTQYNMLFERYRRKYKETCPQNALLRFRNLWAL